MMRFVWMVTAFVAWLGVLSVDAQTCPAPITTSAEAMRARVTSGERCYAGVVIRRAGDAAAASGTIVRVRPAKALAPGRYRLHAALATSPIGDQRVSAIGVTMRAGKATRELGMLHFARAGEFAWFTLDFTAREGEDPGIAIGWRFAGQTAERNQLETMEAPELPEAGGLTGGPAGEASAEVADALKEGKDGTRSRASLKELRAWVGALPPFIETLAPVELSVETDKVVYRTSDRARGTVTVRNVSARAETVALRLAVHSGVDAQREVAATELKLPAGGEREWKATFDVKGLYWGGGAARDGAGGDAGGRGVGSGPDAQHLRGGRQLLGDESDGGDELHAAFPRARGG